MNEAIEMSEADLEIGKLFDTLRSLRSLKEGFSDSDEKVEIRGEEYDAKNITDAMLAIRIQEFKELADMTDPFYVEFISEFKQSPGMADVINAYNEFKAAG